MKFFFFISFASTATNVITDVSTDNPINICSKHLQQLFPDTKSELFNRFRETISNDNYSLEIYHIDICSELLNIPSFCEKCMESFSNSKILCKICSNSNASQQPCKNCKNLIAAVKQLEIYKLCLRKFILNKFSKETAKYFLKKMKTKLSPFIMTFILSGISLNPKEIIILDENFSKSVITNNPSLKIEIDILKAFAKNHDELGGIYKKDLFDELVTESREYDSKYILYLCLRFDYNFYNKITSKDLFNLISAVTFYRSHGSPQIDKVAILDIINKVKNLGFIMDKEDFYMLIDLFIKIPLHLQLLSHFFEIEGYWQLLTEDKIISMLKKIFKINSIEAICPLKDLRIFNNSANHQDEENDFPENYDRNDFYNELIQTSIIGPPKFTEAYLSYRGIIEILFNKFSDFTPNGLVKILCIIFSFMNNDIKKQVIFEDLLNLLNSKKKFYNFTVENALDVIDLYLNFDFPNRCAELMIQNIFENTKSRDELDRIFERVFSSPKRDFLIGIFVKLHGTKNLSESKLNQLIDYLINTLQDRTKEYFTAIKMDCPLSISFQIKYIQRMCIYPNLNSAYFFECVDKEIFAHFSKRQFDPLIEFCIDNQLSGVIGSFLEYLDFDQLKLVESSGHLNHIEDFFVELFETSPQHIAYYLDTPFLYFNLFSLFTALNILFKKNENIFYQDTLFKSILSNPMLQKCFDYSQSRQASSNMFDCEYIKKIVLVMSNLFPSHRTFTLILFESLNLDMKSLFKGALIQNIISTIEKEMKNSGKKSLHDKNKFFGKILTQSTDSQQDYKISRINFFLKNYDSNLYYFFSQASTESFNSLVLEFDVEYLIEIYNRVKSIQTTTN